MQDSCTLEFPISSIAAREARDYSPDFAARLIFAYDATMVRASCVKDKC